MKRQALHGRCLRHEKPSFQANLPNDLLNFIKGELNLVDDEIERCLLRQTNFLPKDLSCP